VRRVSKHEEFDRADLNRVLVAFNPSNLLNRRAALASGVSALSSRAACLSTWPGDSPEV
jgi:hypothetical protein